MLIDTSDRGDQSVLPASAEVVQEIARARDDQRPEQFGLRSETRLPRRAGLNGGFVLTSDRELAKARLPRDICMHR